MSTAAILKTVRNKACLFSLSLILISVSTAAQDCSQEALQKIKGTWKMGLKGSIVNVLPADLVRERSSIAAIHKMVSSKYSPLGCQVLYAEVYGKPDISGEGWI